MIKQISLHLLLIHEVMEEGRWLTSREVAARTGVAGRTARQHLANLVDVGLLEKRPTFEGTHYHYRARPSAEGLALAAQLKEAREVMS